MMYARRPALREYLALLNQVPETFRRSWDAIAIYDLDGTLVAGNRAALDLVGEEFARGGMRALRRGGAFGAVLAQAAGRTGRPRR